MSEKIKLGELGKVVSGSTPKTNIKDYWDGEILWITPAEIQEDDYYIADTQRKITNLAVEKTNLKLLPKGTVLLSSRAPIGKVAICDNDMYCNQGFKNIICSDRLENRYVYYFLKYNVEYIKSLGRGATFKEISKGIVENLEIPYIEKKEQIEIANKLDKITEILKIKKQQIKQFDEIIKSQFVEMFGSVELNDKKFEEQEMSCISDISSSKRIYANEYQEIGIPFYRSKEIIELGHNKKPSIELFISKSRYEEIKDKYGIPKKGDILITAVGTIGETWIVDTDEPFYYKDGNVLQIRLNTDISQIYFKYVLDTLISIFKNKNVSGSAYSALTIEKFKKMKIILPPIELQDKFAEIVRQIDKQKFEIENSLKEMQELYEALMERYFG
jgi:type I restriction enzyme S subunit